MAAIQVDREQVIALLEGIRDAFPALRMDLRRDHPHLDLNVDVPAQPGLAFDVNLNLQGDELHLSAGAFWPGRFPCTDPEVAERYRDAVSGLLSGRYRILEHLVGRRVVKAN